MYREVCKHNHEGRRDRSYVVGIQIAVANEIEVTKTLINECNPRRCCGAQMKMPYQKPIFRAVAP